MDIACEAKSEFEKCTSLKDIRHMIDRKYEGTGTDSTIQHLCLKKYKTPIIFIDFCSLHKLSIPPKINITAISICIVNKLLSELSFQLKITYPNNVITFRIVNILKTLVTNRNRTFFLFDFNKESLL